jgi:hypothetical protein
MELPTALALMLLFLLLKGFFSGSEIALVSSDKIKLRHKAKQGDRGATLALKLFQTPDVLLSTTLVGTNISTVVLTTIGALLMIGFFGEHGELYAFLVLTPLLLVLGEIVPKSVYQQKSDELTPIIIYPLRWASAGRLCCSIQSCSCSRAWPAWPPGLSVLVKSSSPSSSPENSCARWSTWRSTKQPWTLLDAGAFGA